jgi:Domain of unknown function (DUF929)
MPAQDDTGPDDTGYEDLIEQAPRRFPLPRVNISGKTAVIASAVLAVALAATAAVVLATRPWQPAPNPADALVAKITAIPVSGAQPSDAQPSFALGDGGQLATASAGAASLFTGLSTQVAINGPLLTSGGKPEVLYVGAQFCPYCAAETWALLVALGRFGTFTEVTAIRSAQFEGISPVDTWSFYGSSYHSAYLTFVPVEMRSNVLVSPAADPGKSASYRVLQKLTADQQAIFDENDPQHSTPFLDLANETALTGASFPPQSLQKLTWSQITASLEPGSNPGAQIVAAADSLTAQLCTLTRDNPASACRSFTGS